MADKEKQEIVRFIDLEIVALNEAERERLEKFLEKYEIIE